ncbi:MAG TPA: hypothetical protein VMY77_07415 [Chitinophagaceae bacterium]|nr:hypothetical protein [Chitinophagaceae bacterium]
MNTNVMPSIIQIEKESLKHLVTEVKETLATDINVRAATIKNKKFGIVDMWNCQRNVRTAVSMRRH